MKLKIFKYLLLFIIPLLGSCNSNNGNSFVDGLVYENAEKYEAGNFSYDYEIAKLDLAWYMGEITVSHSESTFNVSESGTSLPLEEQIHHYYDQTNKTLFIKFWASGHKGKIDSKNKNLTIQIPKNIDLSFDIDAGDLTIDNLILNNAKIDLDVGNIKGKNLSIKSLEAKVSVGNFNVSFLSLEESLLKSDIGGLTITLLDPLGATITYELKNGTYYPGDKTVFRNGEAKIDIKANTSDIYIYLG
ncbi:MAG: DUF4097 family beta strand repeat protein [Bacilli bacterium]|nr:DUF4097 family beta strand repeat protein [Bacilli bacterium]